MTHSNFVLPPISPKSKLLGSLAARRGPEPQFQVLGCAGCPVLCQVLLGMPSLSPCSAQNMALYLELNWWSCHEDKSHVLSRWGGPGPWWHG